MTRSNRVDHIRITSHPAPGAKLNFPIAWGAPSARERGPVIGTVSRPQDRNVIGTHGGSYSVYRALAVSSGALDPIRRPDLTNTHPAETVGPFPQWAHPQRIVSLDPWGHLAAEDFATEIAEGIDIRPSIAITRARLDLPELQAAIEARAPQARRRGRAQERKRLRGQDCDRPGLVSAGVGGALHDHREQSAPTTVRADRRHVSGTGDPAGSAGLSAADRRHDGLSVRRRQQTA
jgi:GTP cyclohydrolase N terminal